MIVGDRELQGRRKTLVCEGCVGDRGGRAAGGARTCRLQSGSCIEFQTFRSPSIKASTRRDDTN